MRTHLDHVPIADDLSEPDRSEFLKRLVEDFGVIYRTIGRLVGDLNDADDVMQDTCVRLWEMYETFDETRSFRAWACSIARNRAIDYLRSRHHQPTILDPESVANLSVVVNAASEFLELRLEKLQECLSELPAQDRKLIRDIYQNEKKVRVIAEKYCEPAKAVYLRLAQLRRKLLHCVNRKLQLD